jgi:hypothetical protein
MNPDRRSTTVLSRRTDVRGRSLRWIAIFSLFGLTMKTMEAEPFQPDGGPDAIVSMEAEHFDNKVDKGDSES